MVTLAGTVSGNIILTTEGGLNNSFTNNIIGIRDPSADHHLRWRWRYGDESLAENTKAVTTVTATDPDLAKPDLFDCP